jgi:hypothetical protein
VVPVKIETDHLPERVHTAVGPARRHHRPALPAYFSKSFLKNSLDGLSVCLPLKAVVLRAVVSEYKFVMCHAFRLSAR